MEMNNLQTITHILEENIVLLVEAQFPRSIGFMSQAYALNDISIETKNPPAFVYKFIKEFMEAKGLLEISIWLMIDMEAEEILEALVTYSNEPILTTGEP